MSPFWPPVAIQAYHAFNNSLFRTYVDVLQADFRPTAPPSHSNNVLQSKHSIIRSIFLRFGAHNSATPPVIAAPQDMRVRNDLYGGSTEPAFDL